MNSVKRNRTEEKETFCLTLKSEDSSLTCFKWGRMGREKKNVVNKVIYLIQEKSPSLFQGQICSGAWCSHFSWVNGYE